MTDDDVPMETSVELATGTVTARCTGLWHLDELCGFGARNNAKRGFLIVSKVLGRHVPVRPSTMRRSFRDLASLIDPALPGPVLVIGMAETAICLGQGVHEEYLAATGRTDVVTMHSTRQVIDAEELLRFEEPHSHASAHILYVPQDPDVADHVMRVRSLVLVDDEVSSGTTFSNLASAICERVPSIERIVTLTLADWSSGAAYLATMPRPTETGSLVQGTLAWTPRADAAPTTANPPAKALGAVDPHHNYGRLGRLDVADEHDHLADHVDLDRPVLVLGSGEFVYPPFRIAERLEKRGGDVLVQATTRSPVHVGGAIGSAMTFEDNYGTQVPNYIYNQTSDPERTVLVCHETGHGSIDSAFLEEIGGTNLAMGAHA